MCSNGVVRLVGKGYNIVEGGRVMGEWAHLGPVMGASARIGPVMGASARIGRVMGNGLA